MAKNSQERGDHPGLKKETCGLKDKVAPFIIKTCVNAGKKSVNNSLLRIISVQSIGEI
jgi:hypothetical protein